MATVTRDPKPKHSKLDQTQINQGLKVIPNPNEAGKSSNHEISVDIVAVPGLGANPIYTWRKEKTDWLADANMLYSKIPSCRIMVFEYTSQWFGKGAIDNKLENVANQLMQALVYNRPRGSTRPIVFVCHCLGGIITERAVLAAKLHQNYYPNIFSSIVGCVFLGTPFRGTKSQAKASMFAELASAVGLGINSGLMKILEAGNEFLKDLLEQFVSVARDAKIGLFCFWEQYESDTAALLLKHTILGRSGLKHMEHVVEEDSATILGYNKSSLASDHFQLNKFEGPKDGRYVAVSGEISTMVQKSRGIIKGRQNAKRQALVDDGAWIAILRALMVTDPAKDMEASVKGRPANQGAWITSNDQYVEWKKSEKSQVLWIHGSAGQGQAVIASSIIQDLKSETSKDESLTVFTAYFFCDEKDPNRRSSLDVFKVLVRQMIEKKPDLTEYLLSDQTKGKKGDNSEITFEVAAASVMWNHMQNILRNSSVGTVHFIINGLDEMDTESLTEFLGLLQLYLIASEPEEKDKVVDLDEVNSEDADNSEDTPVKWTLLSRSGRPDIEKALKGALVIDMEDKENISFINDGVKAQISYEVDRLAVLKGYNSGLAYFIKRHIYGKAQSNYIYVSLVIQELKNLDPAQVDNSTIRKFLEAFPYGLTEIFEHIRRRVLNPTNYGIEYTKEIFRCLIIAAVAPTIYDLAVIADLPEYERNDAEALKRHVQSCGGFITINEYDDETVEWIDKAAKEHLERYAKDQLSLEPVDLQHGIIALRCLDYVRKTTLAEVPAAEEAEIEHEEEDGVDDTNSEENDENRNNNTNTEKVQGDAALSDIETNNALPASLQVGRKPVSSSDHVEKNSGDEDKGFEYDQDDNQQVQDEGVENDATEGADTQDIETNAGEEEAVDYDAENEIEDTPTRMLTYPGNFWIQHAMEAPPDLVQELDLSDPFWYKESPSREIWWKSYAETQDVAGSEKFTPVHVAAFTGYAALLDYLLDNYHEDELHEMDLWGYQPLYWACRKGDISLIDRLLKGGAEINAQRRDGGKTALWNAASEGHVTLVQYMIEKGATVNGKDEMFGTPLYIAAEYGRKDVVKILLDNGADVNITGGTHLRPINVAAYFGHRETCEMLLDKGADVDPDEEYRYGSALGAAARSGHDGVVRLLLEKGWNVNRKINTYGSAVTAAATYGHTDCVHALLEKNPDNPSMEQALAIASKNGNVDIVQKLLDHSGTIRHQNAFFLAASYGRDECLELLQKRGTNQEMLDKSLYDASDHENESTVALLVGFGADPNAEGKEYGTALTAAAYDGSEGIVKILLDKGADPNKQGGDYGNALQAAALNSDLGIVTMLLDHGAEVNQDPNGKYGSALQAASYTGNTDVVKLLLMRGADPNIRGGEYGYPIIAAADEQDHETLEVLLKQGANANVKGGESNSPPLVLTGFGLPKESLQLLLDHDADIEGTDKDGNTALIATASTGDIDGVEYLLQRGANIHAISEMYGAALHAAASEGEEDMCKQLLEHGADVNQQCGPWSTALQAAAFATDVDCVNVLLAHQADVNLSGGKYGNALQAAALSGDYACYFALISADANIHEVGGEYGTALQAASYAGNYAVIEDLLERDVDVDQVGGLYHTALQAAACRYDNDQCVDLLLLHDADPHLEGGLFGTVAQAASYGNNFEIFKKFVDEYEVDFKRSGGKYGNCLQAAALKASKEFVDYLLEKDLDVNEVSGKYGTALQAAAYMDRVEIVASLLEHGANIHVTGGLYGHALTAASREGCSKTVSLLLDKNPSDRMLDEALIQAVYYHQTSVVETLLKNGANVQARDPVLGSALDALKREHNEEEEANSDDEFEDDGDEDDDDEEDDEEEYEDEDEGDNATVDEGASVVSLQITEDSTDEAKILKLLDEAMAKVKRNPTISRFRSVRKSVRRPQGTQVHPPLPGQSAYGSQFTTTGGHLAPLSEGQYPPQGLNYSPHQRPPQDQYQHQQATSSHYSNGPPQRDSYQPYNVGYGQDQRPYQLPAETSPYPPSLSIAKKSPPKSQAQPHNHNVYAQTQAQPMASTSNSIRRKAIGTPQRQNSGPVYELGSSNSPVSAVVPNRGTDSSISIGSSVVPTSYRPSGRDSSYGSPGARPPLTSHLSNNSIGSQHPPDPRRYHSETYIGSVPMEGPTPGAGYPPRAPMTQVSPPFSQPHSSGAGSYVDSGYGSYPSTLNQSTSTLQSQPQRQSQQYKQPPHGYPNPPYGTPPGGSPRPSQSQYAPGFTQSPSPSNSWNVNQQGGGAPAGSAQSQPAPTGQGPQTFDDILGSAGKRVSKFSSRFFK